VARGREADLPQASRAPRRPLAARAQGAHEGARIVGNLADPASTQIVEILDAVREIATMVAG
jgi:hypothetical protein